MVVIFCLNNSIVNDIHSNKIVEIEQEQWRREEVKAGGGYFENGRKCENFRKSEKILDKFSPKFGGFQMNFLSNSWDFRRIFSRNRREF
jgi:hypothetical protein